jgi:HK97 family phage portal protein
MAKSRPQKTAPAPTILQRMLAPLGKLILHTAGYDVSTPAAVKASLATSISDKESGKPVRKDYNFEIGAKDSYNTNAWVAAAISRIGTSVMAIPIKVQTRKDLNDKWETIEGHEGEILLDYPNPFMSGEDLMLRTTMHMYIGGNAIWGKNKVGGKVDEIWPFRPDQITPIKAKGSFISHYEEGSGKDAKRHDISDIIHFQFPNPLDPYWGQSPLQNAARAIDTDIQAGKWQNESLKRRCVRDGVLSFNRDLSLDQYQETVQALQDQFMGPSYARGPLVVGHEGSWTPTSMTPAEFDFTTGRKFSREEILSVFGVPPMLVGIFDKAALANVRVARAIFWLDTVIPYLTILTGTLNRTLIFDVTKTDYMKSRGLVRFAFDLTKVEALQELLKEKADIADTLWKSGVPWDEIERRLSFGILPFEGSDIAWVPSTIKPVKFIIAAGPGGTSSVPDTPAEDEEAPESIVPEEEEEEEEDTEDEDV